MQKIAFPNRIIYKEEGTTTQLTWQHLGNGIYKSDQLGYETHFSQFIESDREYYGEYLNEPKDTKKESPFILDINGKQLRAGDKVYTLNIVSGDKREIELDINSIFVVTALLDNQDEEDLLVFPTIEDRDEYLYQLPLFSLHDINEVLVNEAKEGTEFAAIFNHLIRRFKAQIDGGK